jgi:hypothetical protein
VSIELDKKIIDASDKPRLSRIREQISVTAAMKKPTCAGFQWEVSAGGFINLQLFVGWVKRQRNPTLDYIN